MTPELPAGGAVLVTAVVVAAAVLVFTSPDPGCQRLARLALDHRSRRCDSTVVPAAGAPEVRGRGLAAFAAATGAVVLVDGVTGVVLAAVLGTLVFRWLRQLEPRAAVVERERVERDLPAAAHLLASAIAAGATPVRALEVVGAALDGPISPQLRRVASIASLGGDLGATWRSIPSENGLAPLARTIARALEHGAPLADALDRLALDLRSQRRFGLDRRARAVGVSAAAPLGLCFLPAFLLIGVVPVVIGVATTIFATIR